MPIVTEDLASAEAIKEQFGPAVETLENSVRQARRALVHGRHAAEDAAAQAAHQVRRHPLSAIALATGAGALAGCVIGFAFGSGIRCGKSS
jgi:ElaB/YqjD/DUF883 family membrane-anchored ribosome-binding protein